MVEDYEPTYCCANTSHIINGAVTVSCTQPGSKVCSSCLLVQYCSQKCQQIHWRIHKYDCKSPLMQDSWKPLFHVEKRQPAFVSTFFGVEWAPTPPMQHRKRKYLWGTIPAIDILKDCKDNEHAIPQDLHLLFAASGDLRNVILSLSGLPVTYTGNCHVVINDIDSDIVARNTILLLVALTCEPMEAANIILHIWYSAFITDSMLQKLQSCVLPLLRGVCHEIQGEKAEYLYSKTWHFGTRNLTLVLSKSSWNRLPSYLTVPTGLTRDQAEDVMVETTLAPSKRDHVDRAMYKQAPASRVGAMKFRSDGMLLPFAESRKGFDIPNPTLFQDREFWPVMDLADPIQGWSVKEVKLKAPPARNDVYGALFFYLQELLHLFCRRIKTLNISFQLLEMNAVDLPNALKKLGVSENYFDRIEVSNIVDRGILGPEIVLASFGPLLKPSSQVRKATLIGVFLNAVEECLSALVLLTSTHDEIDKLQEYMPIRLDFPMNSISHDADADLNKLIEAQSLFRDFDPLFATFMRECSLSSCSKRAGLKIKGMNTIVEKWPLRIFPGCEQEDFDSLLGSQHTGSERYVEWEREDAVDE